MEPERPLAPMYCILAVLLLFAAWVVARPAANPPVLPASREVAGCTLGDLQNAMDRSQTGRPVRVQAGRFTGGELQLKPGTRIEVAAGSPGQACAQ